MKDFVRMNNYFNQLNPQLNQTETTCIKNTDSMRGQLINFNKDNKQDKK